MASQMELFVLTWGPYPRRILIYLHEQDLLSQFKITPVTVTATGLIAPEKPAGTVPILKLSDGTYIKQSFAILEYLEDIRELGNAKAMLGKESRSMRGRTPIERARVREMMAIADEAMIHFGVACHKGSSIFSGREEQSATATRFALAMCEDKLALLEGYYVDWREDEITLANIVLFSFLQFSKEFYGRDLLDGHPALRRFFESFRKRDSARIGHAFYPEDLKALAMTWLE